MYYSLNYFPAILYIIITLSPIKLDFVVFIIAFLFIQPLYLLLVNMIYIYKEQLSYYKSITCMVSVIMFNMLYILVMHKIKTGYFIGDVPEGIYYLMVGIPTAIILIGMLIIYFLRK